MSLKRLSRFLIITVNICSLLFSYKSYGQIDDVTQPVSSLQTEALFSAVDLYQQKQISSEQLKTRLLQLQTKYLWNLDQMRYLKDFYRKYATTDKDWLKPFCQIVSLLKTEFYLEYSEYLAECSQWRRKQIDLVTFKHDVALLGYRLSATQLQEAEVYDQDYPIREIINNKTVTSVGPVQEFFAREFASDPKEMIYKHYSFDQSVSHSVDLNDASNYQQVPSEQSFYEKNKYLTIGLALVVSLVAFQYLQNNDIKIQY